MPSKETILSTPKCILFSIVIKWKCDLTSSIIMKKKSNFKLLFVYIKYIPQSFIEKLILNITS